MTTQLKDSILGIVRHVLTTAGGFATSTGFLTQDDMVAGTGAVMTLIGIIWSVIDKKKRAKDA